MNREWATAKVAEYLTVADKYLDDRTDTEAFEGLERRTPLMQRISEALGVHYGSNWTTGDMYARKLSALNLMGRLEWAEEIEIYIGPVGPKLEASYFHPDIWDAAKSLWRSDHRQEAVEAAARALNAALQKKIGRRDISDASLIREAFSKSAPEEGRARLRFSGDRSSATWRSRQEGALQYGVGCFMAIRNVVAHETDPDMGEQEALELLAALSVLARWIDACTVEAPDTT